MWALMLEIQRSQNLKSRLLKQMVEQVVKQMVKQKKTVCLGIYLGKRCYFA